jgi:hypothetical protein
LEAGDGVQAVVEREARRLLHLLLREHSDAAGGVVHSREAAVGGDGDRLLDGERRRLAYWSCGRWRLRSLRRQAGWQERDNGETYRQTHIHKILMEWRDFS